MISTTPQQLILHKTTQLLQAPIQLSLTHPARHPPCQVTVYPQPPILKSSATTELELRYRPLLVGNSEATLKLESPELGLYEWALRLGGTAINPERSLAFSVPLGGRETQVFRFTHFLQVRWLGLLVVSTAMMEDATDGRLSRGTEPRTELDAVELLL